MCGINGIVRLSADAPPVDRAELLRSRDAMQLRGPDGDGLWLAPDGTVGLGHRRLAIIDLTDAGLQPMTWADGRYRIVFNGAIFNYAELRAGLVAEGVTFASHGDTEVILALYAREGAACLSSLRGMYAFAIWDTETQTLLLARDPYGIKPLYYSESGGMLRFASQVKALDAGGAIPRDVDPAGLVGFLLWGSVPAPHTIRAAVRSLPAGHHLIVARGCVGRPQAHHGFGGQDCPAAGTRRQALESSVAAHLVADVPVALFLSAGLDSSMLAALARRQLDEPPTTLTLKFDEFAGTPLDEAPLAAEVARKLGTRHIERSVRRAEFLDLWPRALAAMDQPSIDGFNTYVVSEAAHAAGFKVVLSGLGGDELLGSYDSFRDVPKWSRWSAVLRSLPGLRGLWPTLAGSLAPGKPKLRGLLDFGGSLAGAYFLRRGLYLPHELPALIGARLAAEGLAAYSPVADAEASLDRVTRNGGGIDPWVAVQVLESTQYMHNQLLRDSDWAAMAHSLELRVPLVDAWLREQLAAFDFEPAKSGGKAAFVREVAPELPESLWNRPKSGFWIPVMEWLDEEIELGAPRGQLSRMLALRVLREFDVETMEP